MRKVSQKRLREEFDGKLPSSTLRAKGDGKREDNRRLTGMGVSRRDEDEVQEAARATVAAYLDFVRAMPCLVTGKRSGEYNDAGPVWGRRIFVEAAHMKGRGAWGADLGNVVPLDVRLHRDHPYSLHQLGPADFQKRYNVNLKRAALAVLTAWEQSQGVTL